MNQPPSSRVTKKLHPGAPGTQRLAERYGSELICVRYRESEDGSQRLTTIELIIDVRSTRDPRTKVAPVLRNDDSVHLRIAPRETELQNKLRAFGARWDPASRTWVTQWLIAKHLKLTQRRVLDP